MEQAELEETLNARIFTIMNKSVQVEYHERFLNFMANNLKHARIKTLKLVENLFSIWKEALSKEKREKKMLDKDY